MKRHHFAKMIGMYRHFLTTYRGTSLAERTSLHSRKTLVIMCGFLKSEIKSRCKKIVKSLFVNLLFLFRLGSKCNLYHTQIIQIQKGFRNYSKRKRNFLSLLESLFDKYYVMWVNEKMNRKTNKKKLMLNMYNDEVKIDQELKMNFVAKYLAYLDKKYTESLVTFFDRLTRMKREHRNSYLITTAFSVNKPKKSEDDMLNVEMNLHGTILEYLRSSHRLTRKLSSRLENEDPLEAPKMFKLPHYPDFKEFIQKPVSYTHLTLPTIYSV
eukprot:TRINITY_DN23230_c0_g1_i1.p1 TRINITY_DN23230_c0_g1~~TRINITY_DN23230_c0_g1_i1.p1  ORF type:complete len:268 (-),score=49.32 TRINITY_DN23230_c0_g1_i1:34-837(-)